MWHETNGTKGASEVATCLWDLISKLPPEVNEITFYSDTAAGQNRNSIVSAMFIKALSCFTNISIINQKFMESGHSEMECDSVHSCIENKGKAIDIFVPDGWYTVARTAKTTNPPYVVKENYFSDFKDFKSYSQKLITNKNKTDDGTNLKWQEVKWFQYRKENLMLILFKTQLSQTEFKKLPIRRSVRKISDIETEVSPLYKSSLPIDKKKLKDLKDLCAQGSIPSNFIWV